MFYKKINPKFTKLFIKEVKNAKSIVITSHISPDDDSIASVLAMYYFLIDYLKLSPRKIQMIISGEKSSRWNYFPNYNEIKFVTDMADHLANVELLMILDSPGWRRISHKDVTAFYGKILCIDHHATVYDKFDLHLVDEYCTSTSEILFRLFFDKERLNKKVCEILLLGILGDTGNFRYINGLKSGSMIVAERLIREGDIAVEELMGKYQRIKHSAYLCLVELMKNSKVVEISPWPRFITAYINKKDMKYVGLKERDVLEGYKLFSQYLRLIEDINWGMVFVPQGKDTHLSLRSSPNSVDVKSVMERAKLGGGHCHAAGGEIPVNDTKEAMKIMFDWMEKNKP